MRLHLPEQSFRILEMLILAGGQVVSQKELKDTLWGGTTFVEFEQSLYAAMNRLRRTLDDSARKPRFIETVPRAGYRFLQTVEWDEVWSAPQQTAGAERKRRASILRWLGVSTGLAAGFAVAGWWMLPPEVCTHAPGLRAGSVTALVPVQQGVLAVYKKWSGGNWETWLTPSQDQNGSVLIYSGKAHPEHLADTQGGLFAALYRPGRPPVWEIWRSAGSGPLAGGNSVLLYRGADAVDRMVAFRRGVLVAWRPAEGSRRTEVYLSRDGQYPAGGGNSELVYSGPLRLDALAVRDEQVAAAFYDPRSGESRGVFLSPDGTNLAGGGQTRQTYSGGARVEAMAWLQGGLLTALWDPASGKSRGIYLSPDGLHPGGGGDAQVAYNGLGRVCALMPFRGGVVTAFLDPVSQEGAGVHFSRDGLDLAGGGQTTVLYDGPRRLTSIASTQSGLLLAFQGLSDGGQAQVFFSPDGQRMFPSNDPQRQSVTEPASPVRRIAGK